MCRFRSSGSHSHSRPRVNRWRSLQAVEKGRPPRGRHRYVWPMGQAATRAVPRIFGVHKSAYRVAEWNPCRWPADRSCLVAKGRAMRGSIGKPCGVRRDLSTQRRPQRCVSRWGRQPMWNDSGRAPTPGCRVTAFRVRWREGDHKPSQFIRFETHEFFPLAFPPTGDSAANER